MADEVVMEFVKRFPSGVEVRAEARLATDASPFTVLFGPSGSGKTTILRCLAGLERPDEGFIRFGDETWFDATQRVFVPPHHRPIGYLFQDYALFPHLAAAGNVAYGLGDVPGPERRSRVAEMVKLLGLEALEDRYPNQLSGGQQQRVALARALVRRPRLLLLDEPLSALDAPSREQLRRDLHALLSKLAIPTLLVTHDRTDTLAFGDRVVVLEGGRVLQNGSVDEVFNRPANTAVARIVGVETVQPGRILRIADGLATVAVGQASLIALASEGREGEVYVCIRAEDVILERGEGARSSARNRLLCRVAAQDPQGPMVRITLDCGFRLVALTTKQACQELGLRMGEVVTALVKAPAVHLVPRD